MFSFFFHPISFPFFLLLFTANLPAILIIDLCQEEFMLSLLTRCRYVRSNYWQTCSLSFAVFHYLDFLVGEVFLSLCFPSFWVIQTKTFCCHSSKWILIAVHKNVRLMNKIRLCLFYLFIASFKEAILYLVTEK